MTPVEVSVIFSSYNGGDRIRRMLDSLVQQTLPQDRWEVIAVDNNSSDNTFEILSDYTARLPIRPLRHSRPGKSRALNAALELARGELLAFTDDDIRADPDWLASAVACADRNSEFGVFGGRILPEWERSPQDDPLRDWVPMGSTFAIVDDRDSGPCAADRVWGPNTFIRRELLDPTMRYREDIGPMPNGLFAMGEDTDIVVRLSRRGARAYRCADAVVHHFISAESLTEHWVQSRAERLGFGVPARCPGDIPGGMRISGVPLRTWMASVRWVLQAGLLYPLPRSKWRFWAIWKVYYMRGYRAGIRRFAPSAAESDEPPATIGQSDPAHRSKTAPWSP